MPGPHEAGLAAPREGRLDLLPGSGCRERVAVRAAPRDPGEVVLQSVGRRRARCGPRAIRRSPCAPFVRPR